MLFNFTKMHGLGNDMILIDDREEKIRNINEFARRILHRNTGVGADNLLIVRKPSLPGADVRMLILNNDGSEAEMCGNGIRCFVKFIIEKGIVPAPDVSVETLSGIKKTHAELSDGAVVRIGVNMGEPKLDCADIPVSAEGDFLQKSLYSHGRRFVVSCVNTGHSAHGCVR